MNLIKFLVVLGFQSVVLSTVVSDLKFSKPVKEKPETHDVLSNGRN